MFIKEVCEKFDITADTLRYYEKVGLIPTVTRNKQGIRDYNEQDIKWVEFVKCMRSAGLPIEVLTEYVQLCILGDETIEARKQILQEQRTELLNKMGEMQKTLDILNYKIDFFEKALIEKEQQLIKGDRYEKRNFK